MRHAWLKFSCVLGVALALPALLHAQVLPGPAVAALTALPLTPAAGAAQPDVIIVEYLDYNCPYCRKTAPELHKLLAADPKVQILYKEWPIFGGASVYAARSAIAATWQGKFLTAHDALIGSTRDLDHESDVDAVLQASGLDIKRLDADRRANATQIDALLKRSDRETHALGLGGTPVFIVGRRLITRSLNFAQLQQSVAQARANRY
jgi:protein-disulfide isomerase